MIRQAVRLGVVLAATGVLVRGAPQDPARPAQTFRTGTDVVFVDVSVRDGNRAVSGLGPDDFELTDNGVRQRVEAVEATAVPIDLTMVVDLSGNPRQPWFVPPPPERVASDVEREIAATTRILRPDDRVRVIAVDHGTQLLSPLTPVAARQPVRHVEFNGLAALYDSLLAALVQPVEPARRHVVVARTKGNDTISSIDVQALRVVAERSDALFHVVLMETAYDNDMALSGFQCNPNLMGFCWPTRRSWVPFRRRLFGGRPVHALTPDGLALAEAARSTGGDLHKTQLINEPTLSSTFRKAFEDFRSGYMLRYTPAGVARTGWHEIEVEVRGSRDYSVRARKGYGIDVTPAAPAPPPVPPVPKTLTELTLAYDRGAFPQFVAGMREQDDPAALMRAFEEAGNPWPAAPKREAAMALEIAEAGVFAGRPGVRTQAYQLLERFSRLVRPPLEADTFERYWHFAALTMLEGSIRPGVTAAFAERAIARFPNEPRFVLSRAIAADQAWATGNPTGDSVPDLELVRKYFGAAMAAQDVSIEAAVRFGFFLHRVKRHEEALDQLNAAGAAPITDPYLRYLRHLFLGHTLAALDRTDEAIAAYRAAQEVIPGAQSSRVALMNTLLLRGDRAAAEALAEDVQARPGERVDPWWVYWQGQYRLHPQATARVRELSR